ncbi:hypothetical protein I546_4241 [Mycobacterium kansasii 732]|nr:hypothetical protein I546_4241 [Mycobacterium kansasii 732]
MFVERRAAVWLSTWASTVAGRGSPRIRRGAFRVMKMCA